MPFLDGVKGGDEIVVVGENACDGAMHVALSIGLGRGSSEKVKTCHHLNKLLGKYCQTE